MEVSPSISTNGLGSIAVSMRFREPSFSPSSDIWRNGRLRGRGKLTDTVSSSKISRTFFPILNSPRSNIQTVTSLTSLSFAFKERWTAEVFAAGGIGTEIYYPLPLHVQECFATLKHQRGDFPISERAADETLALPIYPEMTDAQQAYVVSRIRSFYEKVDPKAIPSQVIQRVRGHPMNGIEMSRLIQQMVDRKILVGIIGMGTWVFPWFSASVKRVLGSGFDVDPKKVVALGKGKVTSRPLLIPSVTLREKRPI